MASPRRRLPCGCLPLLFLALVCLILSGLFFRPLAGSAARALMEDDGPHHADAVVVFGGDEYCTRILTGARLARQGFAPVVIVSGPEMYDAYESDFTIPCATRAGYPRSLFRALPSHSDSTRTESGLLGDYLRANRMRTVLLVTSNYHTRRAAGLFRLRNPSLTVYVEPAPDPYFTPDTWWKTRTGQRLFLLEWTKTVSSLIGY